MKSARTGLALFCAVVARRGLRIMGKGATALPGKIALRICPDFIQKISSDLPVIAITGTNGKTTTTHIIAEVLRAKDYYVVTNVSGANLASGIAATLAESHKGLRCARRTGQKSVAVFEIDEAAFAKVAGPLKPEVCVVTNLFRDQLDRFGELLYTRDCIEKGLDNTDATILLNADDSMISALRKGREERVRFYGVDESTMWRNTVTNHVNTDVLPASSDAEYCLKCKNKYEYGARSFGHFGTYYCSICHDQRQEPDYSIAYDNTLNPAQERLPVTFIAGKKEGKKRDQLMDQVKIQGVLPIPGVHNVYNTISAVAALVEFDRRIEALRTDLPATVRALDQIRPAFGRMEKRSVGNKKFCILLVKNPVGLDRALELVSDAPDAGGVYFLLNSNIADGKDVSWIWDVDFESKDLPKQVFVSGERFAEMYLRLIYSGINEKEIRKEPSDKASSLFEQALERCPEDSCLYVLPNYTAMLALRRFLVKKYNLKDFWR